MLTRGFIGRWVNVSWKRVSIGRKGEKRVGDQKHNILDVRNWKKGGHLSFTNNEGEDGSLGEKIVVSSGKGTDGLQKK